MTTVQTISSQQGGKFTQSMYPVLPLAIITLTTTFYRNILYFTFLLIFRTKYPIAQSLCAKNKATISSGFISPGNDLSSQDLAVQVF